MCYTVFLVFFALFCAKIQGSASTKDNDDATTIRELQSLLGKQSDLLKMQSEELTYLKQKFELLNNECVKKSDPRQTYFSTGVENGNGGKEKSKFVYHWARCLFAYTYNACVKLNNSYIICITISSS